MPSTLSGWRPCSSACLMPTTLLDGKCRISPQVSFSLTSVVGVLAAENAALQKKLASTLRKTVRPIQPSRAFDEEEGFHLVKREDPPVDDFMYSAAPPKKTRQAHYDRKQPEPQLRLSQGWQVEDKPICDYGPPEPRDVGVKPSSVSYLSTKDSAQFPPSKPVCQKTSDSETVNENSDNSQVNRAGGSKKFESNGLITPLLSNGLKKTFVRCRNNMFTIVEEPKDNSNPSPITSLARNPMDSPKKHVNIEQLRLGFSADSKTLFALKRDDPSDVPSSYLVLRQGRESAPQQASATQPGFHPLI